MHNNDIIYGMGIKEYCDRLHITIDDLIKYNNIDVTIIKERLSNMDIMEEHFDMVYHALQKKIKHGDRLRRWNV